MASTRRSLRRYWVDPEQIGNQRVVLAGEVMRHLVTVCRAQLGHRFEVLCGDGKAYEVELEQLDRKRAEAVVVGVRDLPELPRPHLHLAVAWSRPAAMDWIVEKAVELGVMGVWPFTSVHSQSPAGSAVTRHQRLHRIGQAALRQCGRGGLMEIGAVQPLAELLANWQRPQRVGVVAWEGGGGAEAGLREVLQRVRAAQSQEVWLFVGSEGGFAADEIEALQSRGVLPVTLGDLVLRVETACLAVVAAVRFELGQLG
jgi:16S rRNA (uracil1498-N3)-methyltransferase